MLNIAAMRSIFLCAAPTDMRLSFSGLSARVYQHLGRPESGAYYVFVNRVRTRVKILYWDGDGLALWYKRLEKGRFLLPAATGGQVALDRRQLSMLLEGIIPLRTAPRFSLEKKME